jgi:acyl-CoA synthetase (AMP-forming)/AMP-acid ligase II
MASFSFDVFTGDLIRSLPVGSKLVLCPLEAVVDPASLVELMEHEHVDAAEFVPATATMLFEWAKENGRTIDFMRLVVVSSEAWRTDQYVFFRSLCGGETRLVNSYGLTEATIDSTWYEPAADDVLVPGRFMPIGRPLSNTTVYILDQSLEPMPVGIPGELCIGGVAVAQGYLNRPELNTEKFVPSPFPEGGLLYRTGDLARWLADGNVEFIGRADRQLKIRGFRIEPGEIEAVLERHPQVRKAVVTSRPDPAGDFRLVAYLALEAGLDPSFDELREWVAEQTPAYMVPSAWAVVDEFQTTPNGKVDMAALTDPKWDVSVARTQEYVAPSTAAEQAIASIWSDVLSIEQIGVDDNFFALGGHSLLGMRVLSRIRQDTGVDLGLRALFDTPTIAALAAAVESAEPAEATEVPQLVRVDRSSHRMRSAQLETVGDEPS